MEIKNFEEKKEFAMDFYEQAIESLISGINKYRYIEGLKNSSVPELSLRHRW